MERARWRAYASRYDNAGRRRGKCRLITLPAISRYKVDGRRALKPPPRARLYLLCTIPHRFRRLSPGDATRPAASHEVGRQPGVSPRRNWRTIESQRPRNTPFHRHYASALSLYIDIPFPLFVSLYRSFRFFF